MGPEAFWPGEAYVDWVAVDGYNWGASRTWSTWRSPESTLGPMVARLRALAPAKPVAVTETASTSAAADGDGPAAKGAHPGPTRVGVAASGLTSSGP